MTLFAYILFSSGQLTSNITRVELDANEGDGLGAPLSFNMTLWSCYCIVLEKVFVIGWRKEILWTRDGEGLTTRDDEGLHYLIISECCY